MLDRKLRPITKFVHEKEKKYSVYKEQKNNYYDKVHEILLYTQQHLHTHVFSLFF